MARTTIVTLTDDLDPDLEAIDTVSFGLDGTTYEIDLNDEHINELRDLFARYIGAARKVSGGSSSGRGKTARPSVTTTGKASDAPDAKAVREWARSQGKQVNERGRLPASLMAEFSDARA